MSPSRRLACITMDVEFDYHDLVTPLRCADALEADAGWDAIEDLQRRGVPTTAFIVSQVLEELPWMPSRARARFAEIGLHGHTHRREDPDSAQEIANGVAAFEHLLGVRPRGYRAPLGLISRSGLERLARAGFHYDSSISPSWRPGAFRHGHMPREPYIVEGTSPALIELPFATVDRPRLVLSVSYVKLIGLPVFERLMGLTRLPRVAIINCHFHDLVFPRRAYRALPTRWKAIYGRNRERGIAILGWLVAKLRDLGYHFETVGEVADRISGEAAPRPYPAAPK